MNCKKIVSGCLLLIVMAGLPVSLHAQAAVSIVGSGSNVPTPLYSVWTDEFNKKDTKVQVRYLSMSTMEGIHQISAGSGDFAAGEIPLTHEQMDSAKVSLIQIPTVLVGIVPIYNLPGNPEVNFSGEVLAHIFMGTITNWKDPRIAKLNPKIKLPDLQIAVVHRTQGKGSNYIFTDFLSRNSPEFRSEVGKTASPNWPVGVDANRGEDMITKVASIQGAVGYVELNFAKRSDIGYGAVENPAGVFVKATAASISAACKSLAGTIPSDFRVSLINAPAQDAYPITSFTWLYLPTSNASAERSSALKEFLEWSLRDGQTIAKGLGYAVLPPTIQSKAQAALTSMQMASRTN
ncbi:MAG: phosphate ABC transporter substrate-binding protein PstS [Acidobacteriaceae bacterium]|nr:phosphate ABC transporter substrate-binding protein PstS [Acidobacteriaceae bacterium]